MRALIFRLSNLIFKFFGIVPIKSNKIILECEYGKGFYGNLLYIYKEIKKQNLDVEIIIPLNRGVTIDLPQESGVKVITTRSLTHLYHLATSKYWITDNHYYQFLKKRKDTIMINTWHALGAFKKFGLHSAKNEDIERFKKDGENIDYLLVSSDKLKNIYSEALNVPTDRILSLGIPRTDPLFDESYKEHMKKDFYNKYNIPKDKKLILYAPTFRDNEKEKFNLKLKLQLLKESLGNEYLLLIKLHPIIRNKDIIPGDMKDFVLDVNRENINDLMIASDVLITDYSSVVFEYALLNKPMIFFAYDYDDYKENLRDFYFPYEEFVPGPIVKTTEDVIKTIKENKFPMDKVQEFSKEFCGFVGGESSKRFVDFFLNRYKRN